MLSSVQIARFMVSFGWIYHGIFPKLIHVAPMEQLMTASFGFSEEISYWITKTAGVGEVIFGLLLFVFYTSRPLVIFNIAGLVGLLLFVALLQPQILIEAFNPVTTNLSMIAFSVILLSGMTPKPSK
ncbi:DoxX-like family protein [Litoribrevibacter euphylliae]|uniref:DoxX-like family protein n=1 Tax=Litoribrevibacter euphylliae TaxID=1834034 RepID=A0ABV7HGR5_9GAMM